MPKTRGILIDKKIRSGGKIIDLRITPDKKRQVYLEYHTSNKNIQKDMIMNLKLITEIEIEYDEYAIVEKGKGNILVIKNIKVF